MTAQQITSSISAALHVPSLNSPKMTGLVTSHLIYKGNYDAANSNVRSETRELSAKRNLRFVLGVSNSQLKQSVPPWVISSLRSPRESPSSPSWVVRQSCQPCYFYARKSWFDLVPVALLSVLTAIKCLDGEFFGGFYGDFRLLNSKSTLTYMHTKFESHPLLRVSLIEQQFSAPVRHVLMHLELSATCRCR